jgi:hypothetical protein
MQSMYYVGLDVHKKTISYCVGPGTVASFALPVPCVPSTSSIFIQLFLS